MTTDTAGSLTENLIDCIEALGAARPQSKGLSELYQSLATALSTFSGGYPLATPISATYGSNTLLTANTPTTLWSVSLGVGTWLITYNVTIDAASTLSIPKSFPTLTSGAATFSGKYQATTGNATSLIVGAEYELNTAFFAIVTTPADIELQVESNEADTVVGTIGSLVATTGFTATRVA